ncbi:MAG: 4-hydroxy-tetrahydrodipicolinate synthase [Cyclobacteriaceae bacterium]|nr:4-hydroxy-tetrahydrodipicolinate synthase [Cyclobacteriaceae bacterium]
MNNQFGGTGVALVTPFDANYKIDSEALGKIVDHAVRGGVDYLVVMGTTGESVTIGESEKSLLLEVISTHKQDKPLVLGMGGNNTAKILEQLESSDPDSYDAILSVCPYYNKPTQKGLINHFTMIADKSPRPVILYNVPGRTSVNLIAKSTIELSKHPNIIGIKEASGDFTQCIAIASNTDENFLLISGDDVLALPLIAIGAKGLISVIANALPEEMSRIVRYGLNGQYKEARNILHPISYLMELMFREGNPTGVKSLLSHLGLCSEQVRPPLIHASAELRDEIAGAYRKAGLTGGKA